MAQEPKLNIVSGIYLCDACLDGVGGECHTPGCALWISRAPDIPIREKVVDCGGTIDPIDSINILDQIKDMRDALEAIAEYPEGPVTGEDALFMAHIAKETLERTSAS
jgi:hypothetical protein